MNVQPSCARLPLRGPRSMRRSITTTSLAALRGAGQVLAGAVLLICGSLVCSIAHAGDAQAGKTKSKQCIACHGERGQSNVAPTNPILAGQYEDYLVHALRSYRSGDRQNAIMQGFASNLSDEDIDDLAAWFSSQKGPLAVAPRP